MVRNEPDERPARQQHGFTLLEVLAALGLMSGIVISVIALMMASVSTSEISGELTDLSIAGAAKLEELQVIPYGVEEMAAGGSVLRSVPGYSVDPLDGDPNRYLRWEIHDEGVSMKRIVLVAGIRGTGRAPTREMALETYRVAFQ